ncbi:hypothetical protein H5V45_14805 [Nocardioides sp. KIGAM211]|uniref:IPT/TIG domain-containing protein n=1 Tax=Nocardioides luti TaxID=2761101 RepID=A0A7X0RHU7_9ACTN|nr:hypothetical protein [Nocardioides luti]MBB6628593.1 hypothetical protein [Nocardioides luti]
MKIFAALAASVLALGVGTLTASPASAHTPDISASCDGVHVGATAYDPAMVNRWSVTINGNTQDGTFADSFDQTFNVPQGGFASTWSAFVEAEDGDFHFESSGTVGPCGGPPPKVDVCKDLPADQPVGTDCTQPPDVQRVESGAAEGCAVVLEGTSYGAGSLTYDKQYTDTFLFNLVTNTWDLITDTSPSVANIVFTPWSIAQQVKHGCTKQSTQPPALHSTKKKTRIDCGDNVRITTVTTTTTPYVYDDATNTWVLGEPVVHVSTTQEPVHAGDCAGGTQGPGTNNPGGNDSTDVAPAQAHTSTSGPQVLPASAPAPLLPSSTTTVPNAADAGLAGRANVLAAAVTAPFAAIMPTSSPMSRDAGLATLLLMAGLACTAAAFRTRLAPRTRTHKH